MTDADTVYDDVADEARAHWQTERPDPHTDDNRPGVGSRYCASGSCWHTDMNAPCWGDQGPDPWTTTTEENT